MKLPQLDVLRGMCALLVVFYHVLFQHPGHELGLFRNAALFVDFFFVLSGFIMFHNYGNMGSWHDFRRFLALRLFRTYPLHVVMLLVFLAYETLQYALVQLYDFPTSTPPFSDNNGSSLLLNLLLLNGVGLIDLTFNTPSWSISTEFWAYVVFGLCMGVSSESARSPLGRFHASSPAKMLERGTAIPALFAGDLTRNRLERLGRDFEDTPMFSLANQRARLIAFLAIAIAALGFLAAQPDPSLTVHWERFFPRCLFGFFMGAVLRGVMSVPRAAAASSSSADLLQLASMLAAVVFVSAASGELLWIELLSPFVFTAVIACFVAWPNTRVARFLNNAPLLWLGKVSYSIYMVHQFVLLTVEAFMRLVLHAPVEDGLLMVGHSVGSVALIGSLGLVLGVAALTYRFVEEPARRLGRTWLDSAEPATREPRRVNVV